MGALPTLQTPIFDIPNPLRITASKHLMYECIIVGLRITMMQSFELLPVISKDLFENVPALRGFCSHQAAPRSRCWDVCGAALVPRLTRSSYPIVGVTRHAHPPPSPLSHGDFRATHKCKFLDDAHSNELKVAHRDPLVVALMRS